MIYHEFSTTATGIEDLRHTIEERSIICCLAIEEITKNPEGMTPDTILMTLNTMDKLEKDILDIVRDGVFYSSVISQGIRTNQGDEKILTEMMEHSEYIVSTLLKGLGIMLLNKKVLESFNKQGV